VTLIGDAAGSVDPTQGHGTSLLMRDIRELSEALRDDRDWQHAIDGYAERRTAYYDVLHAYDDRSVSVSRDRGPAADRVGEQNARAEEADPALGGWNLIEARGPAGLVPDEAARRHYFGEDL
jgi:2-polyprenyl-6-methoxyphenol hydroxylase-like FAD-dependent oxidoreductase